MPAEHGPPDRVGVLLARVLAREEHLVLHGEPEDVVVLPTGAHRDVAVGAPGERVSPPGGDGGGDWFWHAVLAEDPAEGAQGGRYGHRGIRRAARRGTGEETQQQGRGECFMFWNLQELSGGVPLLLGLFAGSAAGRTADPTVAVAAALRSLRRVFGEDGVPEPVATTVSAWGADPFARGSYSYVAVGSSGKDYDVLGLPVKNKVFFAGEHTCKEYPDTVGGAMLSGLKAANQTPAELLGEEAYDLSDLAALGDGEALGELDSDEGELGSDDEAEEDSEEDGAVLLLRLRLVQ